MKDALVALLRKLATDIQNGDVLMEDVEFNVSSMHDDQRSTMTTITFTEEVVR